MIFRRYLDAVGMHAMAAAEAAGLAPTEWYALGLIALAGRITAGELAAPGRAEHRGHDPRKSQPPARAAVTSTGMS